MKVYYDSYFKTHKKNFMLVVMAFALLIPTFFIWVGVPFFIIGGLLENLTTDPLLVHLCISLSGGLLFSLPFMPINFKAAKNIANTTGYDASKFFIYVQTIFILVCSVIFGVISNIIIQL